MNEFKLHTDKLLRNQIYDFFRHQMRKEAIKPGDPIAIKQVAEQLGVSRTPLREALLQLQSEGFVTILPQRGVFINVLEERDLRNIYEVLGGLESRVILSVFDKIGPSQIKKMRQIDGQMKEQISKEDFYRYYDLNLKFHDVFLNLSDNDVLLGYVRIQKQRLYDFTNTNYGKSWQEINFKQHETFIQLIERGEAVEAANYMRDVHWDKKNFKSELLSIGSF